MTTRSSTTGKAIRRTAREASGRAASSRAEALAQVGLSDGAWRASSSSKRSLRVTNRDREILRWLARHRFATAVQIGRRFDMGLSRVYRRTAELAHAGYIVLHRPVFADEGGVYLSTVAGLAVAASPLQAAAVDVRSFHHDLAVVEVAIELERKGFTVLTERELRHEEAFDGAPTLALALDVDTTTRRHFPDLLVAHEEGRYWAIEVELTRKGNERLERILKSYRRSRHISAVRYYVERPTLAARLAAAGRRLRMEEKLDVRPWPGDRDRG